MTWSWFSIGFLSGLSLCAIGTHYDWQGSHWNDVDHILLYVVLALGVLVMVLRR